LVYEFVSQTSFKCLSLGFRRAGWEPSENTIPPDLKLNGESVPDLPDCQLRLLKSVTSSAVVRLALPTG
jgi:hypothetical protein